MAFQLTGRPTKMPQGPIPDSGFLESSSNEDDFAIESDSDSPDSWSPRVSCLMRNDQKAGKKTKDETDARQIIFYRLPTSSFQTPPSPPSSMLTRGLKRIPLNISQAGMKSAAQYQKREWDLPGWLELRHCQQYELSLKRNKHMIGRAEEDAPKSFEHGGGEEKCRHGW